MSLFQKLLYYSYLSLTYENMDAKDVFNPSIDTIIAKFVPVIGALLFITGLWYLIYTSVWEAMTMEFRLWLWFFTSLVIIGTAFTLSDKLRYFADVVMGWWILLLFWTLIYGSRATDLANIAIPEQATLFTAIIFTFWVSYLASLRKSKVILVLWLLWAYLIPFVIGQDGVWASNVSFNAYLIYFIAVNLSVLIVSRELSTYDIIPANLVWLFISTFSIYSLTFSQVWGDVSFFSGENFSVILLALIVIASAASIVYTSRFFTTKEDIWISLWYLVPVLWFLFMSTALTTVDTGFLFVATALVSGSYFAGWYMLWYFTTSRSQHYALYIAWIIALVKAIFVIFPELNFYVWIVTSYLALLFLLLYNLWEQKIERLFAAILFSFFWALISLINIYWGVVEVQFTVFWAVASLIPAILIGWVVRAIWKESEEVRGFTDVYSGLAALLAIIIIALEFVFSINPIFVFFILPWFITVLIAYLQKKPNVQRFSLAWAWAVWLTIGFFPSFFTLLASLVPGYADDFSFLHWPWFLVNSHFTFAIFAAVSYYLTLRISRQLQAEKSDEKPSFLLVISFYTVILLVVNFFIITLFNDIWVAQTTWGLRAVATTFWWTLLSMIMLYIWITNGKIYASEKIIWIILLGLTVFKIIFYDLSEMDMDRKIIVLMVAGWIIMMFSYFVQSKGLLKNEFNTDQK